MDIEEIRSYCLEKPHVTECFPFDEVTLVMKVAGKIFAIIPLDHEPMINLKCDPERAIELREEYDDIVPGWHMNKKYWNTVKLTPAVPVSLLNGLIDHSYDQVVASLSGKMRKELGL